MKIEKSQYCLIEISTTVDCEEPLSAYFGNTANLGWAIDQKADSTIAVFKVYFESDPNISKIREDIEAIFIELKNIGIDIGTGELKQSILEKEDWQHSWKKNFSVLKIGERVVIKPSWENYSKQEGEVVIECDPGMAFGTGQHPTTRFCLQVLGEFLNGGNSVLDIGCGSAILSIASAKLGAHKVIGFDNDPIAVSYANELVLLNGVDKAVKILCSDLDTFAPNERFDFVLANLYAEMLVKYSEKICSSVSAHGLLALTGIMNSKLNSVKEAFSSLGFNKTLSSFTDDEWSGLLVCR